MAEQVKVLGTWASPFSHRVELALKLKGISYEYLEENLREKSQLLLESNPVHKKIPVLIHNGKAIAESLVILEYIDETWNKYPILPEDAYGRANARFWAKFVDEKIVSTNYKLRNAKEEEREQILKEIGESFKILENELKGKEYFGGENIGYVDIVAFFTVYGFQIRQEVTQTGLITEEKLPILCKWVEKVRAIDVVNQVLPPREKHLAQIRARFAKPPA